MESRPANPSPEPDHLILFVKAPRPGRVKTRLAREIGAQAACDAYRRMVDILLPRLDRIESVELRFAPDDAAPELEPWARPGWHLRPQGDGDLGDRLARAFDESFDAGRSRVAVIGSDCPWIEESDIADAWDALRSHDVAIGPAEDGGYWLIGLAAPNRALFRDIPWSTDQVYTTTMRRIEASGASVRPLRTLSDVDSAADWRRFNRD